MASFKVEWKNSAEHDIRNIDRQYISKILNVIETLSENPFPIQSKNFEIRNPAIVFV